MIFYYYKMWFKSPHPHQTDRQKLLWRERQAGSVFLGHCIRLAQKPEILWSAHNLYRKECVMKRPVNSKSVRLLTTETTGSNGRDGNTRFDIFFYCDLNWNHDSLLCKRVCARGSTTMSTVWWFSIFTTFEIFICFIIIFFQTRLKLRILLLSLREWRRGNSPEKLIWNRLETV